MTRGAPNPVVGIIMGSTSDRPVMQAAAEVLAELGIAHEVRIVSAHRTPDWMFQYASEAEGRGIKVIIAGAGGAAHLPGMTAAKTVLPVIGVPVPVEHLQGLDSLLSIVQMPGGVPVAAVAIGRAGAVNAALLAARILGVGDAEILERVRRRMQTQARAIREADAAGSAGATDAAGSPGAATAFAADARGRPAASCQGAPGPGGARRGRPGEGSPRPGSR
jgi:5-(carboxyamino)imidazole ribonucleotide mutase